MGRGGEGKPYFLHACVRVPECMCVCDGVHARYVYLRGGGNQYMLRRKIYCRRKNEKCPLCRPNQWACSHLVFSDCFWRGHVRAGSKVRVRMGIVSGGGYAQISNV